ncbi:hypothetical protein BLNAU_9099 [Blattamonas nauphoetae]|uniref:Uncharacterized protein n=1 Tax=Blattamonas nauphoetae TaxID=2049346 RepID=A0ABQ9XWU4_9EUKA|nr:hypothetical protein BLNAU_9099 [Blattamonas nauphoetae]
MEMLVFLIHFSSALVRLALVKAGLIPQLMTTLNPLSLSFDEAVDIHTDLMSNIIGTVWLATPDGLTRLEIEDRNEQQAIHETVLKQIVVPSEKYISHLCLNRFSIVDRRQSDNLMDLLTKFLRISPTIQLLCQSPSIVPTLSLPTLTLLPIRSNQFFPSHPSFVISQEPRLNNEEPTQSEQILLRTMRKAGFDEHPRNKTTNKQHLTMLPICVCSQSLMDRGAVPGHLRMISLVPTQHQLSPPTPSTVFPHPGCPTAVSRSFGDCECWSEGATTTALDRRPFLCPTNDSWDPHTDTALKSHQPAKTSDSANTLGVCSCLVDAVLIRSAIWTNTIDSDNKECTLLLIYAGLNETDQSIPTFNRIILASESRPTRTASSPLTSPSQPLLSLTTTVQAAKALSPWASWMGTSFGRSGRLGKSNPWCNKRVDGFEVGVWLFWGGGALVWRRRVRKGLPGIASWCVSLDDRHHLLRHLSRAVPLWKTIRRSMDGC